MFVAAGIDAPDSLLGPIDDDGDATRRSANPLLARLESVAEFSRAEVSALLELVDACECVRAGGIIEREGDAKDVIYAVVSGLACRYKDFRDGRRQIIAILFPGDVSRSLAGLRRPADHHLRALTGTKVARISAERLESLILDYPRIERAWHAASVLEGAVLRAWIVNLGQRQARERLAHLFCEIAHRMNTGNLSRQDGSFELPLTQKDLGTALGLTSVHVNRVLQRLRAESLLEFADGVLRIHDPIRLRHIANFNPTYLSQ